MNSSFSLKSPIPYSFTNAKNLKKKGTASCTYSFILVLTTHLELHIQTNWTGIYRVGTERTSVKMSTRIILQRLHLWVSRIICIQASPANTVKHEPVGFIAQSVSLAFSRAKQNNNSKTTPQQTYQSKTKPQKTTPQIRSPSPSPSPLLCVLTVILLSVLPCPLGRTGCRKGWSGSPCTASGYYAVSRRQVMGPVEDQRIRAVRFLSALRKLKTENSSTWLGGQGKSGTKLAVKHICSQKTRVDSGNAQSYVSSLVIKNSICNRFCKEGFATSVLGNKIFFIYSYIRDAQEAL